MNPDYFEIYKRRRERKYQRDLEKLQEDMAAHGRAQSGFRKKEENMLKQDLDDDVEQMREQMRIDEAKKKHQLRKDNNAIITNRILAGAAVAAVILGGVYFYLENDRNKEQFKLTMRPYIIVDRVNSQHGDNKISTYSIFLKNAGATPGTISKFGSDCSVQDNDLPNSLIGSNQQLEFKGIEIDHSKSEILFCTFEIYYSPMISSISSDIYYTKYNLKFSFGKKPSFFGTDSR